jgi:hypothetical protein
VVRAGELEAAAAGELAALVALVVLVALVAGVVVVVELLPEEQAASVAPRDSAHRIPATDRGFIIIDGPSYLVGIDSGDWVPGMRFPVDAISGGRDFRGMRFPGDAVSGDGSSAGVTVSVWLVP